MTGRTSRLRGLKSIALCAFGSTLMLGGSAYADITFPNVTLEFFASNDGQPSALFEMSKHSNVKKSMGGSVFQFEGGATGMNNAWELEWSLIVSPTAGSGDNTAGGGGGAFINLANLAVTNTTGSDQFFFVLVTLELDKPINVPTFSKGDVAASIQSFTGQGATLKNITSGEFAGDPIYESFIDGVSTHTLMNFPTAITSVGSQTASDTDDFGHDIPFVTGPAMDTIAIFLKIEVTKQSIATVIGLYEITPIPAPAALPLLALGALAGRRRRRN